MKGVEVVVLVVVLSLFAGTSIGRPFGDCFARCYGPCCFTPFDSMPCTAMCLAECAMASAINNKATAAATTTYNFCRLGCATSLCTNFGTKNDPAAKKVGSCVDSCSRTCMNA